jgi:hypothetical protein
MSLSRRQALRMTEERMRRSPRTFAEAMRAVVADILRSEHGDELGEGVEPFPPDIARLLDLCEAAELRRSYRTAAKLSLRICLAVIDASDRQDESASTAIPRGRLALSIRYDNPASYKPGRNTRES